MKFAEIEKKSSRRNLNIDVYFIRTIECPIWSLCSWPKHAADVSFIFFHGWLWSSLSRWRTNPDVSVSLCFSSTGFFSQTSFQTRPFWICSCRTLRRLLTGHTLILNLGRQVMLNTHVHFLDSLIPSAALCLFRPPPPWSHEVWTTSWCCQAPDPTQPVCERGGAALGQKMELGPLPPTEANATEGWCFSATSQPPTPHPLSKRAGALHPTPSRPPSTPSVPIASTSFHQLGDQLLYKRELSHQSGQRWALLVPLGGGRIRPFLKATLQNLHPTACFFFHTSWCFCLFTSAVFPLKRRDNCCNNARRTHDGTIFSAIGYCECHLGQICSYLI